MADQALGAPAGGMFDERPDERADRSAELERPAGAHPPSRRASSQAHRGQAIRARGRE